MKIKDNTNATIQKLNACISSALNEIGATGRVDLMANCVVDTGMLRRGHNYKVNGIKSVTFGNYVSYAPYVEFRRNGSRPWFVSTIKNDKSKFNKILEKHLKKVGA